MYTAVHWVQSSLLFPVVAIKLYKLALLVLNFMLCQVVVKEHVATISMYGTEGGRASPWDDLCSQLTQVSLPTFTLSLLTNVFTSLARMPAILDGEEAVSKWLDFGEVSTQEALKLIQTSENITFHPVSTVVNNSRNNTPECLAPVGLEVKKVGACDSDSLF